MMIKKISIIFAALLLGISLTAADMAMWPGSGPRQGTPGEKQEEKEKKQEKKKEKKVKRIWTDKDLKDIKNERVNITEVIPDPDAAKNKSKNAGNPVKVDSTKKKEKFDPRKTEKYWREKKKELVEKIEKSEKKVEFLEKKLLQLNLERGGTYSGYDVGNLQKQIIDTANQLEKYKTGLAALKEQLENLHEEARRAGALPGWLRD